MKKEEEVLETETRNIIYQFILNYPGVHFSKISRELKIPKSTLNYHLNFLMKNDLITGIDEERYTRFFITKKIGIEDKKLLNVFRKQTQRKIIIFLLKHTGASQIELSRKLKRTPSTISEHLQKLLDLDIIEIAKKKEKNKLITNYEKKKIIEKKIVGREKNYILKNPYDIYKFLKNNESKILDDGEVSDLLSLFEITEY
jgi:predicted transcriptional regulator